MTQARPLSVFLITKNEAENLPRCLDQLNGLADEILILDSGSTDSTEQIAKKYGAKFLFRAFDGFGQQKNAAEQLCTHPWVLNLDADEVLTEGLKQEINTFLSEDNSQKYQGMRLKTIGVYPHKKQPRPFADYHNYIRLYDKSVLSYPLHPTQDAIIATTHHNIGQFQNPALHYSFKSLEALIEKAKSRTRFYFYNEKSKGKIRSTLRVFIEFPVAFFKCYILRRHITGGIYGIKISYIYAKYRFIRIAQRVFGKCLI